MPPRNQPRTIAAEEELALRIGYEREKRGMTYEGLAKRMTDAGCPINQSAIFKIEKAEPRRRITVNEIVALATVFGVTVNDLLLPRDLLEDMRAAKLWQEWDAAETTAQAALRDAAAARQVFEEYNEKHPQITERLAAFYNPHG